MVCNVTLRVYMVCHGMWWYVMVWHCSVWYVRERYVAVCCVVCVLWCVVLRYVVG